MTRYADPNRCPRCGGSLVPGVLTCGTCGLDLSGPLGQELYATLTHADHLLALLAERQHAATAAPTSVSTPVHVPAGMPAATGTPAPPPPVPPVGPPGTGEPVTAVRASAVPKILLGLGAICLLVAALVFLVVTWSRLGVGGRTATLVGFTLATGALTAWAARTNLRGATEALGLVTVGLATLDVVGARNAGWLGDPSDAGFVTALGFALVAGGAGATAALRRTPAGGFVGGELAAVLGTLLVGGGLSGQEWGSAAGRLLVAVLVGGAVCAGLSTLVRAGSVVFRLATTGAAGVATLYWMALVAIGIEETGSDPTLAEIWGDLNGWPMLAAAGVAAGVAAIRRLPTLLRVLAGAAAVLVLTVLVTIPALDEPATTAVATMLVTLVLMSALVAAAPRPWGATGLGAFTLAATWVALQTLVLLGAAAQQYAEAAAELWAGTAGGRFPDPVDSGLEPWLLPLCLAALVLAAWSVVRLAEPELAVLSSRWGVAVAAGASFGVVAMLTLYSVPVWTVLTVLLSLAAALAVTAVRRDDPWPALGAAAVLLGALPLSFYDEHLTAVALTVAVVIASGVHVRGGDPVQRATGGGVLPLALAGLAVTVGEIADVDRSWAVLAGLGLLGVLVLARPALPWGDRSDAVLAALEVGASLGALVLGAVGVDAVPHDSQPEWAAGYLTLAGVVATLMALLRPERRPVAWVGGALLAVASWIRLAELGVEQPEAYTLPSALVLLGVGVMHLRQHPSAPTLRVLGGGLTLALLPTTLWVIGDPLSLRALLLGLACLALVVVGVQLRWSAPLVFGAVVGLVVVLREAAPYVGDTVPRWAVIGSAGALLIALGITWEQRLAEARAVAGYVRRLR